MNSKTEVVRIGPEESGTAKKREYTFKATVVKVIDGDTVDLNVSLGFHIWLSIRTRLRGINAPEVSDAMGRAVRDILRDYLPIDSTVNVTTYKDPTDKYGRWLAVITFNGVNINNWLVENGYAEEKDYG